MHAVPAADERNQVSRGEAALIHVILDRLDRVREVDGIMLALPRLDQRHQHLEAVALRVLRLALIRPSISLRARR
jgi:hypothetical protein